MVKIFLQIALNGYDKKTIYLYKYGKIRIPEITDPL